MLRHHNPAKPDHSIKKIIKKTNFAGHVLCQFVTQAIGIIVFIEFIIIADIRTCINF
jgi:hypothetical protein